MAVLSGTSLTSCLYIPSFIPAGTVTAFQATTAPTSWTKDTTHNNKALRVVSGNITNGGTNPFTTAFSSSFPFSGTNASNVATPFTTNPGSPGLRFNQSSATMSGLLGATLPGVPPHTHVYVRNLTAGRASGTTTAFAGGAPFNQGTSTATGGGGTHSHTSPGTLAQHNHGDAGDFGAAHTHTLTDNTHTHTVSGTIDMSIAYVDIILASKD